MGHWSIQFYQFVIWVSLSMTILWCQHTFNEQSLGVCSSRAVMLSSPFDTDIYVTNFNSIFGTIKVGMLQVFPGWSSSSTTPLLSAVVDHKHCSTACSQPTFLRPHLRCSSQPPLASLTQGSDVQGCCADVQSCTWISTPTWVNWYVGDLPGLHSLGSTRSNRLLVPSTRLSTVGGCTFPVGIMFIWNSLSDTVTSAPTRSTFCHWLKTYLFSLSFPDIILDW